MKDSTSDKIYYAVIFSLFILSILAMSKGIAIRSLWLDEARFAENINNFPDGMFSEFAPCPPLLYLLTYFFVFFLGKSEWVYRLIPFISGSVGLGILFYFLCRFYSRVPAILSCFLLVISEKLIWYSGQAHPFAVDFFCSVVLLFVMTRHLQERSQKARLLWVFVASICLPMSFPSLFVFSAFTGVIILYDLLNKNVKAAMSEIISALVPIGIAFSLSIFVYFQLTAERTDPAAWSPFFPPTMRSLLFIKWLFDSTCEMWGYFFGDPSKGFVGIFLAIVGTAWLVQKQGILLMILCWTPIMIALCASILEKWPYGGVRTMLFCLPFAVILIAAGLEAMWQSAATRMSRILVACACYLLIFSFPAHLKNILSSPMDYFEAMKTLSNEIRPKILPEDKFIVYYGADAAFKFYFPEFIEKATIQSWNNKNNSAMQEKFVLSAMMNEKSRVWLIFSHVQNNVKKEEGWMVSVAKRHRELMHVYLAPDCRAYLFNKLERYADT